ncbi:hypothetical protein EJB05_46834, partial [Eragrostis curvula]
MDPPSAKKLKPFQRTWTPADEVLVLKTLARYKDKQDRLPSPAQLYHQLQGRFQKEGVSRKLLDGKLRSLERRYSSDNLKAAPPADKHERRLYRLSNRVWGPDAAQSPPVNKSSDAAQSPPMNKSQEAAPKARTLGEMRNLYPLFFHEARKLLVDPSDLERVLPCIDEHEARKLEKKIHKIRKQIAEAIAESARIKNMEMPTLCLYPSTKLQPEKLSAEEDNNILSEYFDKTKAQERLAQMEHEVVKLRQMLMSSQSHAMINCDESMAKHIRCESAASVVLPVVAENEIPVNVLQNKVELPRSMPHRKNMEVTSKYTPPGNNIKKMKVTVHAQENYCHERNREGENEVFLLSIRRPYTPLAKAIIESSSKYEIVGDMPLGNEFCKVFVTKIRDATVADLAVPDQRSCQGL